MPHLLLLIIPALFRACYWPAQFHVNNETWTIYLFVHL